MDLSESENTVFYLAVTAGGAIIIIFLVLVTVCCILLKQKKTTNQQFYANSQQIRDARKEQTIYENDGELIKNTHKGKRQFSSVYINRPENKDVIYVNTAAQDATANCVDNDYENVE